MQKLRAERSSHQRRQQHRQLTWFRSTERSRNPANARPSRVESMSSGGPTAAAAAAAKGPT
eukprot:13238715-Heterocapsa_arctica.AAC.1